MKVKMMMNGSQEIVLIPENSLEKIYLEEFSKVSSIQTTLINKQTPILNEVIHDGLIFSTRQQTGQSAIQDRPTTRKPSE